MLWAVFGIVLSASLLTACHEKPQVADEGSLLPELALKRIDGADFALKASGKITLLNMWAIWCPPCREEMPSLQRLASKLDATRFQIIGLAVEEDPYIVQEFLDRYGIDFQVYLIDSEQAVSNLNLTDYPLSLLLDDQGRIAARITGSLDWEHPAISHLLAQFAEQGKFSPEALHEAINQARAQLIRSQLAQ